MQASQELSERIYAKPMFTLCGEIHFF